MSAPINVAIEAAQAAGKIALSYFSKPQKVEYKADTSPVTVADREAEKAARKIISRKFPDHGIIGEELGTVDPNAKYQWTVDPIDGTKSFVRGMPFWSVLIALLENGKPILGVSFAPAMNEILTAQKGKGTYLNGKKTHVSRVSDLKHAYVTHGNLRYFDAKGKLNGMIKLIKSAHAERAGLDPYMYHLLIKGNVDMVIEARDQVYDIVAPSLLVEEAGGRFTNFKGKFSITDDCAVATNRLLHKEVLKLLNS